MKVSQNLSDNIIIRGEIKMDPALQLRMNHEENITLSTDEIQHMLDSSPLVQKLMATPCSNYLSAIFKLIGLAEIPHIYMLSATKDLVSFIDQKIATSAGFSYTGSREDIVPCYNAMLLESYTRLGLASCPEAQKALTWIKTYQLFDRGESSLWQGKGIYKHGGCLKKTPCYIGIGKTVRALLTYEEFAEEKDEQVAAMIAAGLEYMLSHQMFLRLSEERPISPHITSSAFPQSYVLTLTDLVYIASKGQKLKDKRVVKLLQLLNEKQVKENQWKIEYIYTYKGYTSFENRRKASEWLSYLYPLWLT